ncbi:MAG: hypothetical protein CMN52_01515 [SAR116 cluster bacterium]|nr:hypothetical protein [SAR116 cluster bacterium]
MVLLKSSIPVMNKIELGPHVEVDLEQRKRDIAKGQDIRLSIFGSIRKQNGVEELVAYLKTEGGFSLIHF